MQHNSSEGSLDRLTIRVGVRKVRQGFSIPPKGNDGGRHTMSYLKASAPFDTLLELQRNQLKGEIPSPDVFPGNALGTGQNVFGLRELPVCFVHHRWLCPNSNSENRKSGDLSKNMPLDEQCCLLQYFLAFPHWAGELVYDWFVERPLVFHSV